MTTLWNDIRYGARMLLKNPGITLIAVLALSIGIGANTALFSVINKVLLTPLPFKNPEELMLIFSNKKEVNWDQMSVSGADFLDWREQNHTCTDLASLRTGGKFSLTGWGEPMSLAGMIVSANFFDVMQGQAYRGRLFQNEDGDNTKVALLSYSLWETTFGQDPEIVGKAIALGEEPYTVIGILPAEQGFMDEIAQIIVPESWSSLKENRGSRSHIVIGRLKPGATVQQAGEDLNAIARRLAEQYPGEDGGLGVTAMPAHEDLVNDVRSIFLVLYGAVGFVLLIACVNVANLMLAKGGSRSKEIAVRFSMGAGRVRILRQLLTESVVLAFLSGAVGLLIGLWGIDLLIWMAPRLGGLHVPRFLESDIDPTVLAFTLALSMLTGLVFGIVPAWQISRTHLNETLKENSRGAAGHGKRSRMLGSLVCAEIAFSLILLMGAGLMIQSFYRLHTANPGFQAARVLTVELELPPHKRYEESSPRTAFYETTIRQIQSLPGVQTVGAVNHLPLTNGNSTNSFAIEGEPPLPPGQYLYFDYRICTPEFFTALGIPLLKGRNFDRGDTSQSKPVVVVSKEFARRYFPNTEPLGRQLSFNGRQHEIVGIVGDIKHQGMDQKDFSPAAFLPMQQDCWHSMTVVLKTQGNPLLLSAAVRQAIWNVDPNLPIIRMDTMTDVVNGSISLQRFSMVLLSIFSGLALLLASMGIYGVMAYSVEQRTHEIGVRMALGARTGDILGMVLRQGMLLTGIGLVAGLAGSAVLSRFMTAMLYQVKPSDPLTLAAVAVILSGVALLACYVPARRAARVSPMDALRCE